jgi:acetyl esterase/lipase
MRAVNQRWGKVLLCGLPVVAWVTLVAVAQDARQAARPDAAASKTAGQNAGPRVPPGLVYDKDVTYGKGADQDLHLDLARPEKADGPLPCVVFIHGGAWAAGNKSAHTEQVFDLARRGYVAATLQYRFCPKYLFPAQVEDVKCAIRYLRAHSKQYGIDPRRFGAVGFSAGAHLAMMLGTMGKDDGLEGDGGWPDQPSQVQAVVSFVGPTDLTATNLSPVSKSLLKHFMGGTLDEKPAEHQKASPLTYVSPGDAAMLLFLGTKDPLIPHDQGYKMTDALTAAGVPGRLELLFGAGHGWGPPDRERTVEETYRFLDRYLKTVEPLNR